MCASVQLLVLKYVQNKDVFMRYHKAHLTRRLILDISADSEIEENMVEWLRVGTLYFTFSSLCRKIVCHLYNLSPGYLSWQEVGMPADYVNKLARMFQDIKVSEDLNQSFKEMHKHNKLALPGKRLCSFYASCLIIKLVFEMLKNCSNPIRPF